MSTIKDVAALAGVAPSTVSNVFTKKKYVSPKVTRKVREACEQLNYTPSFLASGMRTQKTSLIGLMLSSAAGGFQEFYHYFIEGATIAAAECGYSVILYYEVTDKEKLRAIFASGRGPIEGAVLLTPRMGDFRFIEMETNNIPYVLVGREFLGGGATFVDVCNDTITYEIASRLIGEGRRNFVFLNSAEELYISQDRLKGFNRALREAGIDVVNNWSAVENWASHPLTDEVRSIMNADGDGQLRRHVGDLYDHRRGAGGPRYGRGRKRNGRP